MKDKMKPFGMFEAEAIEDGPHRIAHATHKKEENAWVPADAFDERIEGNDDEPPHQDVVDDAEYLEFLKIDGIKDDANDSKNQARNEDGIAPSHAIRAKAHKRIGNVGAHDEDEDVVVVQDAEDAFKRPFRKAVVKGATEIKDEEGDDEDGARGYLPRITRSNGLRD